MALSQLEPLFHGLACFEHTRATPIVRLLLGFVKLERVETHSNATNIAEDLGDISRTQPLRSLQMCTLSRSDVYQIPLTLDEPIPKSWRTGGQCFPLRKTRCGT